MYTLHLFLLSQLFVVFSLTDGPTAFPTVGPTAFPTVGPTAFPTASPTIIYDPDKIYQEPRFSNLEVALISLGISITVLALQYCVIVLCTSSLKIQHVRLK